MISGAGALEESARNVDALRRNTYTEHTTILDGKLIGQRLARWAGRCPEWHASAATGSSPTGLRSAAAASSRRARASERSPPTARSSSARAGSLRIGYRSSKWNRRSGQRRRRQHRPGRDTAGKSYWRGRRTFSVKCIRSSTTAQPTRSRESSPISPKAAEIDIGGDRFLISYVGGDGNDVTLHMATLAADYNHNGTVDAADYTVSRNTLRLDDQSARQQQRQRHCSLG